MVVSDVFQVMRLIAAIPLLVQLLLLALEELIQNLQSLLLSVIDSHPSGLLKCGYSQVLVYQQTLQVLDREIQFYVVVNFLVDHVLYESFSFLVVNTLIHFGDYFVYQVPDLFLT